MIGRFIRLAWRIKNIGLKNTCRAVFQYKIPQAFFIKKYKDKVLRNKIKKLPKYDWYCGFDPNIFYKDIEITSGLTWDLAKDIKDPWEKSRFCNLMNVNEEEFVDLVRDWIDHNPFLLGPNWVGPMDVGIRSVNFVDAAWRFKDSKKITNQFWQKFEASLKEHILYLKNNFEFYDSKTGNHYISDLLGYLYLCEYFKGEKGVSKKRKWCVKEFLREFDKQIFDEGTSYESSTNYHSLVTEIFYLFYKLSPNAFSKKDLEKLDRMFELIEWCSFCDGCFIAIGDHDSGKVIKGVEHKPNQHEGMKHYKDFGLSIIKTDTWHISLRHQVYKKNQIAGHMHNDYGSITLAVNGQAVFVDPGSYVYTPSAKWRNRFRSAKVHNLFYPINNPEPNELTSKLFSLDLPESKIDISSSECSGIYNISTRYNWGKNNLKAERSICFDKNENSLIIKDRWFTGEEVSTRWNFTLAPGVELFTLDGNQFLTFNSEKVLAIDSDLKFAQEDSYCSFEYGEKTACKAIYADDSLGRGKYKEIKFSLISKDNG